MMPPPAACSSTFAVHPITRLAAKVGVKT